MKSLKLIVLIFGLLLFFNCKNTKPNPNAALASINLQRGDLLLCGDGQFGELKFSLSCDYKTRETFDLAVALLHSFQYNESEKAFVKVIDADPNCPYGLLGCCHEYLSCRLVSSYRRRFNKRLGSLKNSQRHYLWMINKEIT